MSNHLKYKGYLGSIEPSVEDNCLYGKILFINDLITYEAETVSELEKEFRAAVDDYLETCKALGREPQKPCSGSFNVRIGEDLHRVAAMQAELSGVSLNDFVKTAIEEKATKENKVHHIHEHIIKSESSVETTEKIKFAGGGWTYFDASIENTKH